MPLKPFLTHLKMDENYLFGFCFFYFVTINIIHHLVPPAASPKLFLDSSTLCPSLANMHSSLHSPLSRQLSTSSESAAPLGSAIQSVPSTPVRRATAAPHGDVRLCFDNITVVTV